MTEPTQEDVRQLVAAAKVALVALHTAATHLETANDMLLEEGVIEAEDDYSEEKEQIAECREVAKSLDVALCPFARS